MENKDTLNYNSRVEKYFAGKPDLPTTENEITSAGIGGLMLGDSLEKLENVFQNTQRQIQDVLIEEEGKVWPAKKLILNGKYIIAEAINTIDIISVLRTDMPTIKTRNGVYCNLQLDSLKNLKDSLRIDFTHKTLSYGSSGVWFRIDKKSEKKFFSETFKNYGTIKGSKVEELIIVCGDC